MKYKEVMQRSLNRPPSDAITYSRFLDNILADNVLETNECEISSYISNRLPLENKDNIYLNYKSSEPSPEALMDDWLAHDRQRILIVSGAAGTGKTTFVKHYFHTLACQREHKESDVVFLNIDVAGVLYGYSNNNINDVLHDRIRQVLLHKSQTNDLSNNIDAQKFNLMELKNLSKHHKQVVIFIDGVDTLDNANREEVLSSVIRLSSWLDYESSVKIILALRRWERQDIYIESFQSKFAVIRLQPPNPVELLEKRLDFYKRSLFDSGLEKAEAIYSLVESINSPSIISNLVELSGGNTRRILTFVTRFLSFEIFKDENIKSNYDRFKRSYRWWEVLTGIMLRESGVYSEKSSMVCNLFSSPDCGEKYQILIKSQLLSSFDVNPDWTNESLLKNFQSIGYKKEHVIVAIRELESFGLINVDSKYIGISQSGKYYKNVLGYSMPYLRIAATDVDMGKEVYSIDDKHKIWSIEFGLKIISALIRSIARAEVSQMVYMSREPDGMEFYKAISNGDAMPIASNITKNILSEVKLITSSRSLMSTGNKKSIIELADKIAAQMANIAQQKYPADS